MSVSLTKDAHDQERVGSDLDGSVCPSCGCSLLHVEELLSLARSHDERLGDLVQMLHRGDVIGGLDDLNTRQAAQYMGNVSEQWIRDNRELLGGRKTGSAQSSPLTFSRAKLDEVRKQRRTALPSDRPIPRYRKQATTRSTGSPRRELKPKAP